MVTILLQQILDLLKGFFGDFTAWAADVFEKLGLIQEQTENLDDILADTNNISANTNSIASSNEHIKSNAIQINNKLTTIQTNSTTIANNSGSIATSAGTAAAFAEDCATNGLNILDKVTTIASDTTQMRADNVVVKSDLDKIYEAVKWTLKDTLINVSESGLSPFSFDTDKAEPITKLVFNVKASETGTGPKTPSNPYTVSGISTFTYSVNTYTDSMLISLMIGGSLYSGTIDLITGELKVTGKIFTFTGSESWITSTNFFFLPAGTISDTPIQQPIITNNGINVVPMTNGQIRLYPAYGNNSQYISMSSTVAELNSYLASGISFIYPLASPITYSLTPEIFNSIIGINYITSNGNGNIDITYTESVKHYLDKQEA